METAVQGTPITISLTQLALSSGWTVDGNEATHDACNAGSFYLLNYPLTPGITYSYTYQVSAISSGFVQASLGTATGAANTTPGTYTETIVANGTQLSFYANGACSITLFSIGSIEAITSPTSTNTIAFSQKLRRGEDVHGTDKWMFYTYIPDNAFSIYTDTFSFYRGVPYFHEQGSYSRCNFYGVQYPAQVLLATDEQPTVTKTFLSINYQANQLLLPASQGITTSLGQVSELYAGNFLQATYNDGTEVYQIEGLYKASFLRDMNVDLINSSPLKGNWLSTSLSTVSPSFPMMGGDYTAASTPLRLLTVEFTYAHSFQGVR